MTKRNVMISMLTSRTELPFSLMGGEEDAWEEGSDSGSPTPVPPFADELPEPSELLMEGRLITSPDRIELVYEESELSGMEGSVTAIGFSRSQPELVSMMRTGPVRTALVFEENRRHLCLYNTPFSDFEVCVHALRVENRFLSCGTLMLDYLIEIHGARAERCKMQISVRPRD